MKGTIKFNNTTELAGFLKEFVDSTAEFNVNQNDDFTYTLTFTGAY